MDEGYANLPTSHLLGSVPAVIAEEKNPSSNGGPTRNLQVFPLTSNGGYQAPGSPSDENAQAPTNWKGFLNISSYSQYFNVDTDMVVDRIVSSVYEMSSFRRKTDGNPDLYGPVWISTTLTLMLAVLGNFATYVIQKRSEQDVWNFDVGYVNWAASAIYGYIIVVPAAYYFLFQYFGSQQNLVQLWCMWGYALFVFVPAAVMLIVPAEIFRWIIILVAGGVSSWFVTLNLKAYTEEGNNLTTLIASAALLQFALALFIKFFFFA